RCLTECRHPGSFLIQHYGRGAAAAFRLGRIHGMFCLGCCWALMLVGFAAGVANLWWMAALTALMVFEKTGRGGDRGVLPIGAGLILASAIVLLVPEFPLISPSARAAARQWPEGRLARRPVIRVAKPSGACTLPRPGEIPI